jgi:Tfp pilus assembly protein PilO
VGVLIYGKLKTNSKIKDEISQFEEKSQRYELKKMKIPRLKKKMEEINKNFKKFVSILPKKKEAREDRIFGIVANYAEQAGLKAQRAVIEKGTEVKKKGKKYKAFNQVSTTLGLEGTFFEFLTFLSLMENHKSFLQVDSFSVTPKKEAGKRVKDLLGISIKVTTFTYAPSAGKKRP